MYSFGMCIGWVTVDMLLDAGEDESKRCSLLCRVHVVPAGGASQKTSKKPMVIVSQRFWIATWIVVNRAVASSQCQR